MLTRRFPLFCVPVSCLLAASLIPAASAAVPTYASAVPAGGYVRGTVFVAADSGLYSDPAAATGPVQPVVGAGTAYANLYNPFNAHYESDQLVAIGRGGSLTLQFPHPIPVTAGAPQIGVFTSATLVDAAYPDGQTGPTATTFAGAEYGAERSAVVEVGPSLSDMRSLGRVLFTAPGNYYANVLQNALASPPAGAVPADFGSPFTQPLSAFDGKDFAGVVAVLNGSAGGTWLDVPAALGLSEVDYVRFSDPLWVLPDGSTAESRTSIYDSTYVKPADLMIDAVAAIPEPASTTLSLAAVGLLARRRRRGS